MKKLLFLFMLTALIQTTCFAEMPIDSTTLVDGHYTNNITLVNTKQYVIKGFVYMEKGTTLTIPQGTIIYGDFNTKGTLIIQRGAQIIATGSPVSPIVFTSRKPAGSRATGDWGGVILLGRAGINTVAGADSAAIEGLPAEVTPAYYGGQPRNDADNSGILRFVRIEYAGINLTGASGNEINGLSMGGVGSGTTIDYVQVSYSGDDAYENFGGTVNLKHLIAYRSIDDDFDSDNGYRGYCQFLISIRDSSTADQSTSNGFEIDNNANSPNNFNSPRTQGTYSNVTMVGPKKTLTSVVNPLFGRGAHTRRNNLTCIYNTVFMGWNTGVRFDGPGVFNAMLNDSSKFRSNIIAGATNIGDTAGSTGSANFGMTGTAFIQNAAYNNRTFTNNTDLNIANPWGFYTGTPDFRPNAGSNVLIGGTFTYPNLNNPFFTPVTYVGAFDATNDWTSGWSNWNPQTKDYTVGIISTSTVIPSKFELSQNYPNPFNPSTKINFSLPKNGFTTLKIFNVAGKEVSSLVNNELNAGTYSYEFDASGLSSGIYFYTLRADNFSETKKMFLVK